MENNLSILYDNRYSAFNYDEYLIDLRAALISCLKLEGLDLYKELSISFVGNQEIRQINRDFRGVDSETDVLSFPVEMEFHIEGEREILGDIIISIDRVKEQAEEYGHSFKRELIYLTVHSMLHLLGYDHMQDEEKQEMRAREEEVMKAINVLR